MRTYQVGTEKLWSVTTILQVIRRPGLERWRGAFGNAQADRIASTAADFGTRVHALCEAYNRGDKLDTITHNHKEYVEAYIEWFDRNVKSTISVERTVVSHNYGYAGKTDLYAVMKDGRTACVDLKTSKHITPVYALQTMAYKMAIEEEGDVVDRRIVLQIAKPTDEYPTIGAVEWEFESDDRDRAGFIAALDLFHWLHESGMWEAEYVR